MWQRTVTVTGGRVTVIMPRTCTAARTTCESERLRACNTPHTITTNEPERSSPCRHLTLLNPCKSATPHPQNCPTAERRHTRRAKQRNTRAQAPRALCSRPRQRSQCHPRSALHATQTERRERGVLHTVTSRVDVGHEASCAVLLHDSLGIGIS